jgi:hypothetical protein
MTPGNPGTRRTSTIRRAIKHVVVFAATGFLCNVFVLLLVNYVTDLP